MKKYNKYSGGYYTVEATFVVTICVFVIMAILYTGLYVHDRMIVESFSQGYLGLWARTPESYREDESEIEDKIYQKLEANLFLCDVGAVHISRGILSDTVEVSYGYPISVGVLERILGGSDTVKTYSVEAVEPAKLKWDAMLVEK